MYVYSFNRLDLVNNPGEDKPAFTIWFAGCTMRCKGCHNTRLWDHEVGEFYKPYELVEIINKAPYDYRTVVLLGGDPLDQNHTELHALCLALDYLGYNIWLYTGREFDDIPANIRKHLFAIKTGKYIEELKQDGFPASINQKLYKKNEHNKWEVIK